MAAYWLTFRIADKTIRGFSSDDRRSALYAAVQTHLGKWWVKPTSFIAFSSDSSIE